MYYRDKDAESMTSDTSGGYSLVSGCDGEYITGVTQAKSAPRRATEKGKVHCDRVSSWLNNSIDLEGDNTISLHQIGEKITIINNGGTVCVSDGKTVKRHDGVVKKQKLIVLRRQITDDDIDTIAVHIGYDWRRLGVELGFSKGDLDDFEYLYGQAGLYEIAYKMMLAWREKQGLDAFIGIVVAKLLLFKRADVAKLFHKK